MEKLGQGKGDGRLVVDAGTFKEFVDELEAAIAEVAGVEVVGDEY